MKNLLSKIRKNKGSVSLVAAIAVPVVLLLFYVMIDFVNISNQKADIKRKADSAVLTMVNESYDENVTLDENGFILDEKTFTQIKDEEGEPIKFCQITKQNYEKGINQLKKDLSETNYDTEYFEKYVAHYDDLTDLEKQSLKDGVARIRFKGYANELFARAFIPNWKLSFLVDASAACVGSLTSVRENQTPPDWYIVPEDEPSTDVGDYVITYNLMSKDAYFIGSQRHYYSNGDEFDLPIPKRDDGLIFGGWYDNSELSGLPIAKITKTDEGDKEFYASWGEPVTITFVYRDKNKNNLLPTEIKTKIKGTREESIIKRIEGWVSNDDDTVIYDVSKTVNITYERGYYWMLDDSEENFYISSYKLSGKWSGVLYNTNSKKDTGWSTSYSTKPYTLYGSAPAENAENIYVGGYKEDDVLKPSNMDYWFVAFNSAKNYNLKFLDTSKLTSMNKTFAFNETLVNLDLTNFNTDSLQSLYETFLGCTNLKLLNVSNWTTPNLNTLDGTFKNCENIEILNLNSFNVSKVTTLECAFENCFELQNLLVDKWDVSKVQSLRSTFQNNLKLNTKAIENWNVSSVTDMRLMLYSGNVGYYPEYYNYKREFIEPIKSKIEELNLSKWKTLKLSNLCATFKGLSSLKSLDLLNWDVSHVYDFTTTFEDCKKLEELYISSWDTSKAQSFSMMFRGCQSLKVLDISDWNVSNVNRFDYMFSCCYDLKTLDLSKWTISNPNGVSVANMFWECHSLEEIDLSNSNIIIYSSRGLGSEGLIISSEISNMLYKCYGLKKIIIPNLTFTDGSIEDFEHVMPGKSENLEEIDFSNWDLSKIDMFPPHRDHDFILSFLDNPNLKKISISASLSDTINLSLPTLEKDEEKGFDEYWHDINDTSKKYLTGFIPTNTAGTYIRDNSSSKWHFEVESLDSNKGSVSVYYSGTKNPIICENVKQYNPFVNEEECVSSITEFSNETNEKEFDENTQLYIKIEPKTGYAVKNFSLKDLDTGEEKIYSPPIYNSMNWITEAANQVMKIEFASTGGLYDADGKLLDEWHNTGIDASFNYDESNYATGTSSANYILKTKYPTAVKAVLPDYVNILGDYSFYGTKLTTIELSNSITKIGNKALANTTNLTKIILPSTVETIDQFAFSGSGIQSINIPENVISLGKNAFYQCSKLQSVTIPSSIDIIDDGVFQECTALTTANLPNTIKTIGKQAFRDCKALVDISLPNSVELIDEYAFTGCSSIKDITLPENLETINKFTFSGCSALVSVKFNDKLKTISDSAFNACSKLASINLPDSITTIEQYAFYSCTNLSSVKLPANITALEDYVLYGSKISSIVIPDKVERLGKATLQNCKSLTSISLPSSLKTIDESAIRNCTKLSSITIPENVTYIGKNAFYKDSLLTSIIFKNNTSWYRGTTVNNINTAVETLTPSLAAQYFVTGYYNYYWKR